MTDKTRNLNQCDFGLNPAGYPSNSSVLEQLSSEARESIADGKAVSTLFGSYRLIRTIGSGGMGQIYEAEHQALKKRVAIKFLLGSIITNAEAVVRFQRESQSIGQLDHPNILRATDAGCIDGLHFLVTDLLCGQDLSNSVCENGPMPLDRTCSVMRQAALGLSDAHSKGFVHRDIKPSNLFLQTDGTLKLLDFGLVRRSAATDSETKSGTFLGTVDFLSPEQASHPDKASAQSDIYSLGCTWIFLLSGQCPYPDETHPSLIAKLRGHMMDQPDWLLRNERRLPKRITQLLFQMVAKLPNDRPMLNSDFFHALSNPTENDCTIIPTITTRPRKRMDVPERDMRDSKSDRTVRLKGRGARTLGSIFRLSLAPAIILSVLWLGGISVTFIPFQMEETGSQFPVIQTSPSAPVGVLAAEQTRPAFQTTINRQTQSAPVRSPGSKILVNRFAHPTNESTSKAMEP